MLSIAPHIDSANSYADSAGMSSPVRNRTLTEENLEESRLLKEIWKRTAKERAARGVGTQELFGLTYEIGNQSFIGFCLNGQVAISLKAALGFARGLGCFVSDFSPRLAREQYPGDPPPLDTPAGRAEEIERLMAQMSVAQQRQLLDVARHMAGLWAAGDAPISLAGMHVARLYDQLPEDMRRKVDGALEIMAMTLDGVVPAPLEDQHDQLRGAAEDGQLPKPEPADRW